MIGIARMIKSDYMKLINLWLTYCKAVPQGLYQKVNPHCKTLHVLRGLQVDELHASYYCKHLQGEGGLHYVTLHYVTFSS